MSDQDNLLWDIKDKAPVVQPDESNFPPLLNYSLDYELDCYEAAVARMKPTERDRFLRCMSTLDIINGFIVNLRKHARAQL
jgi:hypothetical protein